MAALLGKRLLICSSGVPHKFKGASTVLFYRYIKALKKMTGRGRIFHLLLLESNRYDEGDLAAYIAEMEEPKNFDILVCRTERYIFSSRHRITLNTKCVEKSLDAVKRFYPDVVFGIDFISAWVALHIPCNARLVWLGDLNFETFWYNSLYAVKERQVGIFAAPKYLAEGWINCKTWKKTYRRVLHKIDRIIVSSQCSVERLRSMGISSHYLPYPWPHESKALQEYQKHLLPSFLFYGNLVGLGSRSAFQFMIKKLYPALLSLWGKKNFQIFICGRGTMSLWAKNAIDRKPEFKWCGFVENIEEMMSRCHAVLAPIDVPLGNRSRIVTAMANGALVIAHKNTSLGNPDLKNGETCFLARNCGEFVKYMHIAVDQPTRTNNIAQQARECYQNRFSPSVATGKLVAEIRKLMQ